MPCNLFILQHISPIHPAGDILPCRCFSAVFSLCCNAVSAVYDISVIDVVCAASLWTACCCGGNVECGIIQFKFGAFGIWLWNWKYSVSFFIKDSISCLMYLLFLLVDLAPQFLRTWTCLLFWRGQFADLFRFRGLGYITMCHFLSWLFGCYVI